MQSDADEYIAYRHDKYTHAAGELSKYDEEEFDDEKGFPNFKWNQYVHEYNSLAPSEISFKRVKRDDEEDTPADTPDAPPDDGSGGGSGSGEGDSPKLFLTPIIAITGFFAFILIVGPFLVRKGPNRGIVQCSIMLTAFCMWIFWVTVYIGQMNPLMGPRLDNTTVAWIALKWGNPVKPAERD